MQHRIAPKLWAPKLIAILLLLSTIFTLLPITAFADDYNGGQKYFNNISHILENNTPLIR